MIDFNEIVKDRCLKIQEVLSKKAEEYATDSNRFHNFDKAAVMSNSTPEKALWGFLLKHIVSVSDMVDKPSIATEAMVDEKIGDCINYLILLEGLFKRRMNMSNTIDEIIHYVPFADGTGGYEISMNKDVK